MSFTSQLYCVTVHVHRQILKWSSVYAHTAGAGTHLYNVRKEWDDIIDNVHVKVMKSYVFETS